MHHTRLLKVPHEGVDAIKSPIFDFTLLLRVELGPFPIVELFIEV